jgi:hypothetical protein
MKIFEMIFFRQLIRIAANISWFTVYSFPAGISVLALGQHRIFYSRTSLVDTSAWKTLLF